MRHRIRLASVGRRVFWAGVGIRNAVLSTRWPSYSRLVLMSSGARWVLREEVRELATVARRIGIPVIRAEYRSGVRRQAVFHSDQFFLMNPAHFDGRNRIGFSYFHGRSIAEEPNFWACYQSLTRRHESIHRVQVSHRAMRDMVLESGIAAEKVFMIPIGVNLSYFQVQTPESRRRVRRLFGLPQSAVVIGSFQKDGVGWREGLEPKRIKGPDVLLKVIEMLRPRVPGLFVLLSGPARGYVKAGLEKLNVPYRYIHLRYYPEVGRLFQALDLYLVTAREEGGPKAVLETMASGVPLVTTRVGQAMDLVRHGENGWIVDVGDTEGLAHWAEYAIAHRDTAPVEKAVAAGRETAEANTYERQVPLWREFMRGFVAEGRE